MSHFSLRYEKVANSTIIKYWHTACRSHTVSGCGLASFPGSCAWAEKKEPGTLFLHAEFPPPRIFGNFNKICFFKLTYAIYAVWRCLPLTMYAHCGRGQRSDEGSKLFSYTDYPYIHPFHPNTITCEVPIHWLLRFSSAAHIDFVSEFVPGPIL